MQTWISVCLSVCLSVSDSVSLSLSPSVSVSLSLSLSVSVCLSVSLVENLMLVSAYPPHHIIICHFERLVRRSKIYSVIVCRYAFINKKKNEKIK